MSLNYLWFFFYKHLHGGGTTKYIGKSLFEEKMAIFSINGSYFRKRLIRSEKYWWKMPIKWSQICLYSLISRWYKNDMQEFLKLSFFPFYCCPKIKILSKIAKNTKILTLIRPRKIYSKNSKIVYSFIQNHIKVVKKIFPPFGYPPVKFFPMLPFLTKIFYAVYWALYTRKATR